MTETTPARPQRDPHRAEGDQQQCAHPAPPASEARTQRVELGKHEIFSITSFGIYAEVALMHLLLKVVTQGDPTTRHAQYALTEVADECRHSTMFGRGIEKAGVRPYLAPWWFRLALNF